MWTKLFKLISNILALFLVCYLLVTNGGKEILYIIKDSNILYIVIAFICFIISIILGSLNWSMCLKMLNISNKLFSVFALYYKTYFLNAIFIPLAGEVGRVYTLKRKGVSLSAASVSVFAERYISFVTLVIFSFLSSLVIYYLNVQINFIFYLLLLNFGLFLIVIFCMYLFSSKHCITFFQKFQSIQFLKSLIKIYCDVNKNFQYFLNNFKGSFFIFFISCCSQGIKVLGCYFCAKALSLDISIFYFFCFISIISIFVLFPVNIGGWGLPQGISIYLYTLPGVVQNVALDNVNTSITSLVFLYSTLLYIAMLMGVFFISFKYK